MAKRKQIVNHRGRKVVEVIFPVWYPVAKDTQAVRFNPQINQFEWTEDPESDDWGPMDWRWWLGSEENPISKKEILESLTHLTTLLKTTK